MRVELRLPQQDVEANVTCYSPSGQKVQVSKVVIEPLFHDPKQRAPLLYGLTTVAGPPKSEGAAATDEEIQRFVLAIGGTNAKVTLSDRSKRVRSHFEVKRAKTPSPAPVAEAENEDEDAPDTDEPELPDDDE